MENLPNLLRPLRQVAFAVAIALSLVACSSPADGADANPDTMPEAPAAAESAFDGIRRAPVILKGEGVCDGTSEGIPDAPPYEPGIAPLVLLVRHPDNPDGSLIPAQAGEVISAPHVLACIKADLTDEVVEECQYDGGITIEHRATDWTVRLLRADNGDVLESTTMRGDGVSCATVIFEDRVLPVMPVQPPGMLASIQDLNPALDPHEVCATAMLTRAADVNPTTATGLKARLLLMTDFPEAVVLPETMRAPNPLDADVAICVERADEGAHFRAVIADGTIIGEWMLERPEGETWGQPLPVPTADWFMTNIGPALGN